jgi:hypothetical protein
MWLINKVGNYSPCRLLSMVGFHRSPGPASRCRRSARAAGGTVNQWMVRVPIRTSHRPSCAPPRFRPNLRVIIGTCGIHKGVKECSSAHRTVPHPARARRARPWQGVREGRQSHERYE